MYLLTSAKTLNSQLFDWHVALFTSLAIAVIFLVSFIVPSIKKRWLHEHGDEYEPKPKTQWSWLGLATRMMLLMIAIVLFGINIAHTYTATDLDYYPNQLRAEYYITMGTEQRIHDDQKSLNGTIYSRQRKIAKLNVDLAMQKIAMAKQKAHVKKWAHAPKPYNFL